MIYSPVDQNGEEEIAMSLIRCHRCEIEFRAEVARVTNNNINVNDRDILSGTVICGDCGTENLFRLRGEIIEYRHDPTMYGALPIGASGVTRDLFTEAIQCFINRTFRACASMCRATLEQTLVDHGYESGTLETRINAAKEDDLLDEEQVAVAHGSRLMGNRALHRAPNTQPGPALGAIGAVVSIVEHILEAAKGRDSASQSEKDSNAS